MDTGGRFKKRPIPTGLTVFTVGPSLRVVTLVSTAVILYLSLSAVVASGVLSSWNADHVCGKSWFSSVMKPVVYTLPGPVLVGRVSQSLETLRQLTRQSWWPFQPMKAGMEAQGETAFPAAHRHQV